MSLSLRYRIDADAGDENWQLSTASFKLRRMEFGASADAVLSETSTWQNRVALTRHSFTTALTTAFEGGTVLRYSTTLRHVLLRIPERQFTIDSALSVQHRKNPHAALGAISEDRGRCWTSVAGLPDQAAFGKDVWRCAVRRRPSRFLGNAKPYGLTYPRIPSSR